MFSLFSTEKKKTTFSDGTTIIFGDDGKFNLNVEGKSTTYTTQDKYVFTNDHGEKVVEVSGLATDGRDDRSWALATFDKGGCSSKHFHKDRTEIYYVTSGVGKVILDGKEHIVNEGESIEIPAMQHHQVINGSDRLGLEILVICTPPWIFDDMNLVESESQDAFTFG